MLTNVQKIVGITSMKPKSDNVLKFRRKGHSYRNKKGWQEYEYLLQIINGNRFPKAPYLGQIHYDFDLKRTLGMKKKTLEIVF